MTQVKSPNAMLEQIDEEGYVILRGVLSERVVDEVRAELSALADERIQELAKEGLISDTKPDAPFERRMIEVVGDNLDLAPESFRRELHRAPFYDVFFNLGVLNIVESIIGPEIRLYPNYHARVKLPDSEAALVLWHQDGALTEFLGHSTPGAVTELRMVNLWTPLVPARVGNGCMQFVPRTHKLGVVPHVKRQYYWEITPEIMQKYENDTVDIELDPGDIVFFNNMLFHRGLPNHSDIIRWNLDWRYQDATQPTLRLQQGHLARSARTPDRVVRGADQWTRLGVS